MTLRLPRAWLETTIDELFRTAGGGTPATGRSEFWGKGVPWITSADIDEAGDISPRKSVTLSGIGSSATNPVPPGSVVVVTRVGLGKVGLAKQELCFSQDCQALLFNPELLDPPFVAHQTRRIVRGIRGRGTTIAGVTVKQLRDLPFSLAPLPEQHRIVDAIDSYLTRLDDAVASLERVRAKLKAYRASVLKAAVEGRLVPTEASLARAEKRAFESADALLARVLKERRRRWEEAELARLKTVGKTPKGDKWKANYREPVAPDLSGLPELPEGWCWASVDQVGEDTLIGLVRNREEQRDSPPGYPYLKMDAIGLDGSLRMQGLVYVDAGEPEAQRYSLRANDILFNTRNSLELVGKTALVPSGAAGALFNNNIMRMRVSAGVAPGFIALQMSSLPFRERLEKIKRSTTSVAAIYGKDLFPQALAIAPVPEQERITEAVEALWSTQEAVNRTVVREVRRMARLRQSILKWAFEGKLVGQDPADEPADKLLARIRAERAATAAAKKNGGRLAKGAA